MATGKASNATKSSSKAEKSKKDDDLSKPKVSSSPAAAEGDSNNDSVLTANENIDEVWDIVCQIPSDESKVCRIDDCDGVAVATWASNRDPDDKWDYCASCQERDFPPETPKEGVDSDNDNSKEAHSDGSTPKTEHEVNPVDMIPSNTIATSTESSTAESTATPTESQEGKNGSSPGKLVPKQQELIETAVISDDSEEENKISDGTNDDNSSSDESSSSDEIVEGGNLADDSRKELSVVEPSTVNESPPSSKSTTNEISTTTEENDVDMEESEIWTLIKVLPLSSLSRDATIKCSTDECTLAACSVWRSNQDPTNWYSCIDCQENDFDGWPNEELPIEFLAEEHKCIMAEKCSSQRDPIMPLLPSHADGSKVSATSSPRPNTTDAETTSSHTITPPPTNLISQARKKNWNEIAISSAVTPSPAVARASAAASKAKTTKPSEKLLGLHRKWQAEAIAMGGPDARIVVDKSEAKKLIFELLYDGFRPFNITEIFKGLKAVVPSPVLKSCLNDMALDKAGECFADSDDEDDKKKPTKKSSDPFEGSLCFKGGRNTNTSLYYVDHTKQKNSGNGLEVDSRDKLFTEAAKADGDQEALKVELKNVISNTNQLLSEPTNEEAEKSREADEKDTKEIRNEVEEGRKLKVNEKHKKQTKRRIDTMTSHWRKRKRICMDFLIMMEESTDGAVSMKKCLNGDGPIECDSDEAVADGAIAYGVKKRSLPKRKMNSSKMVKKSSTGRAPTGITASEDFVAVKLSSKGEVIRIWIDEEGNPEEEGKKEKKVAFC